MKTKKCLYILLLAVCCVATCLGLTCCKKHTHTYTETVVKATCTDEGYTLYECECGDSYRALYTEPLGHDFRRSHYNEFEHWYECDCGETTLPEGHIPSAEATETSARVCTECGYVIEPALGHVCANHLSKIDKNESSCTKEGNIEYYICSCGKWFYDTYAFAEIGDPADVVIEKQDHVFSEYVVSEDYKASDADCEFPSLYYCSCKCGEKSGFVFDYGEPLGHDWGDWAPSEEEDGLHMRTCSRNREHAEYSLCSGGSATCAKKAVCEVCGGEYGKLKEHTYSWEWSDNETHHWKNATCGCDVKGYYEEHELNDNGNCTVCSAAVLPTPGITYAVSDDGTYAEVTGYTGDSYVGIRIADTYNGLPVKRICDGAFQKKDIYSAIIPNGVTAIGASAFRGCFRLTSVTIPDSVTSIGDYAFADSWLTSVMIPSGVTELGDNSFRNCSGLQYNEYDNAYYLGTADNPYFVLIKAKSKEIASCTIHEDTIFIACEAFDYCGSLAAVTIGNRVTRIGVNAFLFCDGLTNITVPDSVTSIGEAAFQGCERLTDAVIGDGVTEIGECAFRYCYRLTSVTLGNRVARIGKNAFERCYSLTRIAIPDSVTEICDYAFWDCYGLTEAVIGDGVAKIGEGAFYECIGLLSVTIGRNVTSIAEAAFDWCNKLVEVINKSALDVADGSVANGALAAYALTVHDGSSKIVNRDGYWFITDNGTNYLLGYGRTNELFGYNGTDVDLVLPQSYGGETYRIYDNAFGRCVGIASVVIGDGVTVIGKNSFNSCYNLTTVVVGSGVTEIELYAFSACYGLRSITIPNSVTSIGYAAFQWCSGLTDAVIGNGVTKIGGYAFDGCASLSIITIPNSVTSIGGHAFENCYGLVSVTIGSGVTEIGLGAFTDCYRLVEVIDKSSLGIAEGSEANGGVAYYALTVHNGSSKIVNRDGYLFFSDGGTNYLLRYGGTDTDLVLPQIDENKTYEIYRYAFYECRNLTSVIIPDCVTSIGYKAFFGNYNRLSRVIIGDGVTTIGGEVFGGNAEWEYIVLGKGVTRIAATAFKNAFGLKTVYYKGTLAEYGAISIEAENEYLRSAKIYCYSETAPGLNSEWTGYVGEYWHYADGVPTVWTVENEESETIA